jgi:hypothetical protein
MIKGYGTGDASKVQRELYERMTREGEQKDLFRRVRDAQLDRARGQATAIQRENEGRRERAMRAQYVAADKSDTAQRKLFAEAVKNQEHLRQREQKRQVEQRLDREQKARVQHTEREVYFDKLREKEQLRQVEARIDREKKGRIQHTEREVYFEKLREKEQLRQVEDRVDRDKKDRISNQKRAEHEEKGRAKIQVRERYESDMRRKEWERRYFELDMRDKAVRQRVETEIERMRVGGDVLDRTCGIAATATKLTEAQK